jgi:hypothetical protein
MMETGNYEVPGFSTGIYLAVAQVRITLLRAYMEHIN